MANLLATQEGQSILKRAACWLSGHRISRSLKRSFYRAFKNWEMTDNFDLSMLLNNLNPTVQDELLSLGQLYEAIGCPYYIATTQNMDIYVDAINGSDTEGNGSATSPYASLTFLSSPTFPLIINHFVRIHILSDIQMTSQVIFPQIIGPGGCITLMGVGPESVVNTSAGTGPFALSAPGAHAIYQSAGLYQAHNFHTDTVFNVDELAGKWMQFLSGDLAGVAIPVHSNETNNLWTRVGWPVGGVAGDVFQIIEPAHTLSLPGITFACRGSDGISADILTVDQARFVVYNLEIDVSVKGVLYPCTNRAFHLRNQVLSNFSFVRVTRGGSSSSDIVWIENAYVNYGTTRDPVGETHQGTSITNIGQHYTTNASTALTNAGFMVWDSSFPPITYTFNISKIVGPAKGIYAFDAYGMQYFDGRITDIKACGFDTTICFSVDIFVLEYCLFSGRIGGTSLYQIGNFIRHRDNYFRQGSDNIRVDYGRMEMGQSNGAGAAGYTGVGIRFYRAADVVVTDNPAPITGATGDIFINGGTGLLAYPAANNYVGAEGNYLMRY